jgi:hypothetical protein
LAESKEMSLVQTAPPSAYVKTGRRPGRPKNIEKVARNNTKINEFFAPASGGQPSLQRI